MSGQEAIALLEQGQRYTVIISDYSMPNGNGAELYRYIVDKGIDCSFILFTNHNLDAALKSQFQGVSIRGIVSKGYLRDLCTLLVKEIANRDL